MVAASRDQGFRQSFAGEEPGFSRQARRESSARTASQGVATLDRALLIKLLNMTESRHDGEVLSAIRKSNDLLRRNQLSWSDLVGATSAPQPESERAPERAGRYQPDFHDLRGPVTARGFRPYWRTTETRAAPDSLKPQMKSVPLLLRILLFPLWLVAELHPRHAGPERTKVARGTAMFIAVSMYLLCFGLSVVALREAFRF
jgi:hypothetical protein